MINKVVLAKYLGSFFIFLSAIAGLSFPLFFRKATWQIRGECLAGGIFLGAGIVHLLDDAFLNLQNIKLNYPLAPAVCLATFVIFTLISFLTVSEEKPAEIATDSQDENMITLMDGTPNMLSDAQSITPTLFGTKYLSIQKWSLYIILCIHSFIEGFGLGILLKFTKVVGLYVAMIGFKPIEAFALGLFMIEDRPKKSLYWILSVIYSILTPIFSIVGIYIDKLAGHDTIGIISAFSAGSFLYVGSYEWKNLLYKKKDFSRKERAWNYFMFLGGVVWMLFIAEIETIYE
ncbi:ZIP Zinc transporter family protein [Trichomonas vaginalis G3]|uniref:ZIP Zinc transporter family protein n=1 Tax=Trichomonas vaginalis (strain ATCC PRA-98 / G3) TaxID=412133 RepID=A2FGV7_TRIV3|nr:zinc ion transmembrane transporter protein [Trichomonas vaginalis G3]EAX95861.1 ZIP Zinc transporter family protein [Trichomonas vaginalis G3]KAI5488679.1 zinc ion transmembrane transporter protein [Trichomonas vaginalis G3]|eukprot:XP_001308791.1 ZIP Zinc transporter family protein [Trichomonas vaginalis G3]